MRRPAATLAVAVLLVVAGCSAGGGDTTTPQYDTDAEPVYETPLDAWSIATANLEAMREAETFTLDRNLTYRNGDGERWVRTSLVRANTTSGVVYEHVKARNTTRQTYWNANGTGYYRLVRAGEFSYGQTRRGMTNASQYAKGGVPVVADVYAFDYVGAKSVNGERVHVYRADSLDPERSEPVPFLDNRENGSVTRAEATLEFHADGTLRCAEYVLEFESDRGTEFFSSEWCIEDVGDTDVSPPQWVSKARNATG